jgi:Family of unknown function (DUF5681)
MPWKKGQSGNPLGRLPGEKQFADQLRIVLAEPVDKNDPQSVRKMPRIAEKLVECEQWIETYSPKPVEVPPTEQ